MITKKQAEHIAYQHTEIIFDDEDPELVSYEFTKEAQTPIGEVYFFRVIINGKKSGLNIAVHKKTGKCFPAMLSTGIE